MLTVAMLGCGPELLWPDGGASGEDGDRGEPYAGLLRIVGTTLLSIDPIDASTQEVCDRIIGLGGESTQSLAFTRDGRLFATYGAAILYEIDPCACEASLVGAYADHGVTGIFPDRDEGLWGVTSDTDVFVQVDPDTAATRLIGSLGRDVTNLGATWSERDDTVWVLLGSGSGELYTADPATGTLTFRGGVGMYLSSVGFEYHPGTDRLYACSADGVLLTIDRETGVPTVIGDTGYPACDNLGAPTVPQRHACLP